MNEQDPTGSPREPVPEAPQPTEEASQGEATPVETPLPKEVRTWAMLCHLIALAGFLVPFGNIIGPLVLWLVKREENAFIDTHGKESLNFQISLSIYLLVASVSFLICVGFVLVPAMVIAGVVLVIIAGIKANDGKEARYPLTLRFLK